MALVTGSASPWRWHRTSNYKDNRTRAGDQCHRPTGDSELLQDRSSGGKQGDRHRDPQATSAVAFVMTPTLPRSPGSADSVCTIGIETVLATTWRVCNRDMAHPFRRIGNTMDVLAHSDRTTGAPAHPGQNADASGAAAPGRLCSAACQPGRGLQQHCSIEGPNAQQPDRLGLLGVLRGRIRTPVSCTLRLNSFGLSQDPVPTLGCQSARRIDRSWLRATPRRAWRRCAADT